MLREILEKINETKKPSIINNIVEWASKEIEEGGGGPRGNFNLGEPNISLRDYIDSASETEIAILKSLKKIKTKYKGNFNPEAFEVRTGAIGNFYRLVLWKARNNKSSVFISKFPNGGSDWQLSIGLGSVPKPNKITPMYSTKSVTINDIDNLSDVSNAFKDLSLEIGLEFEKLKTDYPKFAPYVYPKAFTKLLEE